MMYMYCIHDKKADAWRQPFFSENDTEAKRMITTVAIDPNSQLFNYAEDFDLYAIGAFDNTTGMFDALTEPDRIAEVQYLKFAGLRSRKGNEQLLLGLAEEGEKGLGEFPDE